MKGIRIELEKASHIEINMVVLSHQKQSMLVEVRIGHYITLDEQAEFDYSIKSLY